MGDEELTKRLCALLGEIPTFQWMTTGTYSPSDVAVFYGAIGEKPDRAVGVRVYAAPRDDELTERRVQIRLRGAQGAPNGADALADIVFAALQGLSRKWGISGIRRDSMAPLGADGNGRDQRSENYIITLDNLEAQT